MCPGGNECPYSMTIRSMAKTVEKVDEKLDGVVTAQALQVREQQATNAHLATLNEGQRKNTRFREDHVSQEKHGAALSDRAVKWLGLLVAAAAFAIVVLNTAVEFWLRAN